MTPSAAVLLASLTMGCPPGHCTPERLVIERVDASHPFYWAAFRLHGRPD